MLRFMRTIRTPKKRRAFLAAIAAGNSVSAACQAADTLLPTRPAHSRRDVDGDFGVARDEAIESGTERLEDEAVTRCCAGAVRPKIFGDRRPTTPT
jgi:hypothetical protein